ncbi:MAG: ABC transporter ATP-binding protein, partial [Actinomycetota bacterium]|nr:ABC transporter ATP-binding protein [Actinomycetota bacterium]
MAEENVAIDVQGVSKTFRIPRRRAHTLKERATDPLRRGDFFELHALDDVSFQVKKGEFFGIVGRNGSGKSTLLKLLASIHDPDSGSVRIAGRLAPFIELGVGFNVELTALDNIVLNGVLMGLSPDEAKARAGSIIEIAGLEDFVDLELRNYSSGMRVRLGFALMSHVDADILLADEVLAVGDVEFQRKCVDTFGRLSSEGRTIVLVSHSMEAIRKYCDRALLLEDGRATLVASPDDVATAYLRAQGTTARGPSKVNDQGEISEAWLEDQSGERRDSFKAGTNVRLVGILKATSLFRPKVFRLRVRSHGGLEVFASAPVHLDPALGSLEPGESMRIEVAFRNNFGPGRYHVGFSVGWPDADGTYTLIRPRAPV